MNRAEHYAEAEQLLADAVAGELTGNGASVSWSLLRAQVHATLAMIDPPVDDEPEPTNSTPLPTRLGAVIRCLDTLGNEVGIAVLADTDETSWRFFSRADGCCYWRKAHSLRPREVLSNGVDVTS